MSYKDDFNIFVGADYGIFKGAKAFHGQSLVKNIQSLNHLSKETNITAMTWDGDEEENILLGLSNQVVKTYDTKGKAFCFSTDAKVTTEDGTVLSSGRICGLSRFNGALVTATESGHIRVLRYNEDECVNIDAGNNLSKMRHSKVNCNIIGTGGQENELKLWDLNTGQKTFEAKNIPNDQKLQLRQKVWVSDLTFLPTSQKVVVASRYGYVRLYDPKAQRRPVLKIDLPERAISCIAPSNREDSVLCGLAKGDIVTMDLRNGKPAEQYKGFYGAVQDIVCHPTEPYVASVSLDRFLRVHDLTTKKLLVKEFLVTRMNCVLMRSNFSLDLAKKSNEDERGEKRQKRVASGSLLSDGQSDNEEQSDDVFDTIQVSDSSAKKLRKIAVSPPKAVSPSKKKSSQLLVNPFASRSQESERKPGKTSPIKNDVKPTNDDSDDDIMIISETVGGTAVPDNMDANESEPDEADGESDELEDSDEDEEAASDDDGDDDDAEGD